MLEAIPPGYWMVVIAFAVGFFCFVLYQLGMLFRETKDTVKDSRRLITEAEITIKNANEILVLAKDTISEVNNVVLGPVRKISGLLLAASSFMEGLTSKKK